MGGSVADRQDPDFAAKPGNLVERTRILVENLQIRDVIGEQDSAARDLVRKRLSAIYAEHTEKGLVRSGATLKAGIEICEQQAVNLVASLVRAVAELAQNAAAFVLIEEAIDQFLSFVEGELESIVKKVEYEIQDLSKSRGFSRAAERLWAERRASILEKLERHRAEFVVPPELLRVVSPAPVEEQVDDSPVPEAHEVHPVVEQDEDQPAAEADDGQAVAEEHSDQQAAKTDDAEPGGELADVRPVAAAEDEPVAAQSDERSGPEHADEPVVPGEERSSPSLAGHWHDMWADIAIQLYTGKLRPKSQADLGNAMAKWFAARGIGLDGPEVEQCARRFWQKYAATQRIRSSISRTAGDRPDEPGEARFDWLAEQTGSGSYSALANEGGRYLGIPEFVRYGASGAQGKANGEAAAGVQHGEDTVRLGGRFEISGSSGRGIDLTAPALDID